MIEYSTFSYTINSPLNNLEYAICNDDALNTLRDIDSNTIDLIVTSPPYNIGKSYEVKTSIDAYLRNQEFIIKEMIRVLSSTGSLCWEIGNFVDNGEIYPLDVFYYEIFKKLGLKLRNRIIWYFGHGLHASNRFSGRYEIILWFTKSNDYVFNLDSVRVPSKYPGKLHYKGPKKGKPSGNPLGKNPSDIWEILNKEWESGMWNIPNVKSNHPEKTIHPCQFPIELVERCVLALTNEKGWVLDPFGGVGSSLIAALKNNRNGISIEKEPEYCKITQDRIIALQENNLKIRYLGTEIHKPSSNNKLTKYPDIWDLDKMKDSK